MAYPSGYFKHNKLQNKFYNFSYLSEDLKKCLRRSCVSVNGTDLKHVTEFLAYLNPLQLNNAGIRIALHTSKLWLNNNSFTGSEQMFVFIFIRLKIEFEGKLDLVQ